MRPPFNRAQAAQNRAFLRLLGRSGNVRLACRELGLKYGTMQHRRRGHAAFAAHWDAALAVAQARLAGTVQKASPPSSMVPLPSKSREGEFRTIGGETAVVRLRSGKLQIRRAQAGKLTRAAEQAFLAALSATCNVSLAAAAVGASPRAFYRRKRQCAAFERELRMALADGWTRLEAALLESGLAGSHEHDEWRSNEPPAIPPMTASQALQLMYLHQKSALQLDEPDYLKRRRGESLELQLERLARMAEERERRARAAFEVAEVERWEQGQPASGPAGAAVRRELGLPDWVLPDLAQVTGWSRADPGTVPHDETRALFGGWRIEDMEESLERGPSRD